MTSADPGPLSMDVDADSWVEFWNRLDEPPADALTDAREQAVRAHVREVVGRDVAPRASRADLEHRFVDESIAALARAGLTGLLIPEEYGGTDDSHVSYALAVEEIALGCGATSLVYMTQMHAAYPILSAGSTELAKQYVPGLVTCETYGSLGITEPDAGSDAASLRTRATPSPDGSRYQIRGSKIFITTGDRADVIICFATVDPAAGHRGITAFVMTGDSPGLRAGEPLRKMGMHGSSTAELFFDDVDVPSDHRLGAEGEAWSILMRSVVKSRISAAAQGVGLARAAYGRALATLRLLHGRSIPQDAQFALADLRGRILQGRLLLLSVARRIDTTGTASTGQVGMMKQHCTDLGWHAAVEAVRLLGPHGDLVDLGVERCLRDVKVTQIYDGTNEVQRLLIARDTEHTMKELR
ncbi:acyl-CoA dehydrogenase family protein [Nocardia miyunensis]|uniref:acyl-CoA dehydrogenase family protein n=1 Tax=Nocardia miyunensis TaxID=282684 RepID=UPI00083361A5|nr:acyl-CoA dehydrogenase family protein [Nocardia miyunensis]